MENKQNGEYGIIKNVGGATYYEGGYNSFNDAVEGMIEECLRLTPQELVSLAKRPYCNEIGEDYMIAVGFYDEETGEAGESMTLAEAVARMDDEVEEEEEQEMNEECEEESYRTIRTRWPAECSGCLYRKREYIDEIDDYVECIHPIFSRQSYQCPVRMTARAKKKFGRTALDDYI